MHFHLYFWGEITFLSKTIQIFGKYFSYFFLAHFNISQHFKLPIMKVYRHVFIVFDDGMFPASVETGDITIFHKIVFFFNQKVYFYHKM
jgi:hypothetical protein